MSKLLEHHVKSGFRQLFLKATIIFMLFVVVLSYVDSDHLGRLGRWLAQ